MLRCLLPTEDQRRPMISHRVRDAADEGESVTSSQPVLGLDVGLHLVGRSAIRRDGVRRVVQGEDGRAGSLEFRLRSFGAVKPGNHLLRPVWEKRESRTQPRRFGIADLESGERFESDPGKLNLLGSRRAGRRNQGPSRQEQRESESRGEHVSHPNLLAVDPRA